MAEANSNKWKSKLLSSSVPLEYEAAQVLVRNGFMVDADFSYSRDDAGVRKDFSVDIHATYFAAAGRQRTSSVYLLVECKHRHRGVTWLFFPDPNTPENSMFFDGATLRSVDTFSHHFLPKGSTRSIDRAAINCFKGVEIEVANGSVHDSEIRHGLLQLQYALPRLLADSIAFHMGAGEEDNLPFFFAPILLTTSPLVVANKNITMSAVEAASCIEDIAQPAPWVVVYTDCTPEFNRHRALACEPLNLLAKQLPCLALDDIRRGRGEHEFRLPSHQLVRLATNAGTSFEYFTQSIVCTYEHFPALVAELRSVAQVAAKRLRKTKPS